jgi:hypothetical protein
VSAPSNHPWCVVAGLGEKEGHPRIRIECMAPAFPLAKILLHFGAKAAQAQSGDQRISVRARG